MYRRNAQQFSSNRFKPPAIWRRPVVVLASLGINILALALPIVILQIYDRIIPNEAYETFLFLMIGMFVVVLVDTMLKVFRSMMMSWEGASFDHRESLSAMNKILDADTLAFDEKPSGYYLDKMHSLEQIQEFYSGQSVLLMMDVPFVVIFMILIWIIAGPLILVPVTLLVIFIAISIVSGQNLHTALETRATMEDRRQNFIIESLRGIHTIKSMAMEPFMLRRYEKLQDQSATSVYELSRINSVVQGVGATFSQLAVLTFVGFGSLYVLNGELTIGALAAGSMLSSRVLQPGLRAMGFWTQFQSVRLALKKVSELYSLQQEKTGSCRSNGKLKGRIQVNNLSFKYPSQTDNLFQNVYLDIEPGEAIGFTGGNGVGKSTLIGLLSGIIRPNEGEILLDGKAISGYELEYLRSQIGLVPQKGILFEGTILENMTLYREDEAMDDAIELARLLGLDEIISRLPNGLDTKVGGAAVDTLSEGVRQKVIMVRALVGQPSIIMLDDANANFDIKNDMKFLSLMNRIKGERTLVVVSHRPSLLRICDRCFEITNAGLHRVNTQHRLTVATPRPATSAQG